MRDRHAGRLRQLADAGEVVGIQVDDAFDEIVAGARPRQRDRLVADVMTHGRGARREQREISAAFALQPKLIGLESLADLVVADPLRHRRGQRRILDAHQLRIAEFLVRLGRRRVVPVTVDDQHGAAPRGGRQQRVEHLLEPFVRRSGMIRRPLLPLGTGAAHARREPGLGDGARRFAHLFGAAPTVDQRARDHVAALCAPGHPREQRLQGVEHRLLDAKFARGEQRLEHQRLEALDDHAAAHLGRRGRAQLFGEELRAREPELRAPAAGSSAACAPPSNMGEATRRGAIGDMIAASTNRPPAASMHAAAACFAAGDVELRSKKYASRFRCGPRNSQPRRSARP